jgi:hypothetical protein
MTKMEMLRAALKADTERSTPNKPTVDTQLFKFYDAADGSTTTFRFLPDANEANPYFWVEKQVITLPFSGVVGHAELGETTPVQVRVPCSNMFEPRSCPIIKAIAPWWKGSEMDIQRARTYYKKSTFYYSGLVVSSPLEEQPPENPIRRLQLTSSLHNIIKASLESPDMTEIPTAYQGGTDFYIKKTKKGQYADYTTSNWARRERDLSTDELAAIEKYGLIDLSKFLGERPTADQMAMIKQMFQDSLDGLPFDNESFGNDFRPYAVVDKKFAGRDSDAVASKYSAPSTAPWNDETEPAAAPAAPRLASSSQDLLARLKKQAAQ